ncbi:hypothetical protein GCM10008110_27800 [Marinobacter persicus]|nr:hypothetical protein GCM10008110_27800 [Marinobacter persicus]
MILKRIFDRKSVGFYVDVGAHHPKRFSNTYYFYRKGWNGINIDARPGSMQDFSRVRPRDVNLEVPVSEQPEKLKYYMFNEPALNGFDPAISEERNGKGGYEIESVVELETMRLDKILDEHLPHGKQIDFLSVDVEGLDLAVLKSLDLQKYTPGVILVEILGTSLDGLRDSEVSNYLMQYEYSIFAKSMNTVFFKRLEGAKS